MFVLYPTFRLRKFHLIFIDFKQAAAIAHSMAIHIITVAVNVRDYYGQRELRSLTSDPDDLNLLNFNDFDDLLANASQIENTVLEAICNSV